MGGELAEISPSTTDVLLEAASFQREGIQRTRRRLALSTEASTRFERGVDPQAVVTGGDRACRLMVEWCDASVLLGALDVGDPPRRRWVSMRASRSSAIIGYEVSVSDAEAVFDRLGMAHERADDDTIRVEAPGYRFDLEREVDLIEEVVRLQGYDRVGSTLPAIRQPGGVPERYAFVDRIRLAMTRAGLREVRPMPFLSDKELRLFGGGDAVRITNPLQADDGLLRTQLLPGLLRVARRNAYRQVRQVAIFEVSQHFRLVSGAVDERRSVAFVMTGSADESWHTARREFDVFDAKGVVEELLAAVGVAWTAGDRAGAPFHPGRSAHVVAGSKTVGVFGELHPSVAAAFDLTGRVAVGELDVDAIADRATDMPQVSDVPRFPPVRRDLAFVVDASTQAGRLHAALEEAGGELVDSVVLFDVHAGPPLPDGKKSLAFSVDLRASDRTLTDAEANDVVEAIAERLARDFGAELRSS